MKIKNIRTKQENGTISLLADCKIRTVGWDTVYFTFPEQYASSLYKDATPFAAALLIPSMYLGQDLEIDGSISEEFLQGMHDVMKIMTDWKLPLKKVAIHAKTVVKDDAHPQKVATFFSGGVDSFYTYLKHKPDATDKISHFILVNGADIDPRNRKLWEETKKNILDIAGEEHIDVLTVDCNVQSLLEPIISPDLTHGGCLAAVGLCFRREFKKIYIPASFGFDDQIPYGTHPDLDKHWSSEIVKFEHDGSEADRFEKIDWQIAKSPLALKHLRVCARNIKGQYNCGRCEKCLRTMTALYIAGVLKDAKTFPPTIDVPHLAYIIEHAEPPITGHKENLDGLRKKNMDPEMQKAMEEAISKNHFDPRHALKERMVHAIIYTDHMYLRGKAFKIWLNLIHPY